MPAPRTQLLLRVGTTQGDSGQWELKPQRDRHMTGALQAGSGRNMLAPLCSLSPASDQGLPWLSPRSHSAGHQGM